MICFTVPKARKKYIVVFGIVILALLISCKNEKKYGNKEIKGNIEKGIDGALPEENDDVVDILGYKVKEEFFKKDSLQLIFKNIYLYPLSDNEYKLEVEVNHDNKALNYFADYYIVLAIYPKDNEIHLLDPERQKYKFETFSVKIRKSKNEELIITRKIKTKLNFARAVTVSVMAYKTKQKSMEVVLMNVNF